MHRRSWPWVTISLSLGCGANIDHVIGTGGGNAAATVEVDGADPQHGGSVGGTGLQQDAMPPETVVNMPHAPTCRFVGGSRAGKLACGTTCLPDEEGSHCQDGDILATCYGVWLCVVSPQHDGNTPLPLDAGMVVEPPPRLDAGLIVEPPPELDAAACRP
jgi:hypothetical protein